MTFPVQEYAPGEPAISARDLNAVLRELTRLREMDVEGGDIIANAGSMTVRIPAAAQMIYAELTSESSGYYAWTQQTRTADRTWDDTTGGLEGTIALNAARDINGATGIPAGTIVQMVQGYLGLNDTDIDQEWLFDGSGMNAAAVDIVKVTSLTPTGSYYPCKVESWSDEGAAWSDGAVAWFLPANGGTPVLNRRYLALQVDVDDSGVAVYSDEMYQFAGITVKEADGTPTYTGVSTFIVDQADGFSLSQPGAGQARLDLLDAGSGQAGKVNTTTQNFYGAKTFIDPLAANSDLAVAGNYTSAAGNITLTNGALQIGTPPYPWYIDRTTFKMYEASGVNPLAYALMIFGDAYSGRACWSIQVSPNVGGQVGATLTVGDGSLVLPSCDGGPNIHSSGAFAYDNLSSPGTLKFWNGSNMQTLLSIPAGAGGISNGTHPP